MPRCCLYLPDPIGSVGPPLAVSRPGNATPNLMDRGAMRYRLLSAQLW
jgi:hypothetical protein